MVSRYASESIDWSSLPVSLTDKRRDDQKQLDNGQMCSTCLAPFLAGSSSVLRITCPKCQKATFCNKTCYNRRRETAAHHELLCEGSNPACRPLWLAIKAQKLRYLHCVARLVALWRGAREWGEPGQAEEIEQRVWKGMARVNMRDREMALREWRVRMRAARHSS